MSEEVKVPTCFTCMDHGFMLYKIKHDNYEYDYIAKCACAAGERFSNFVPTIETLFDAREIAKENFSKFWNWYKDNPNVRAEIERRKKEKAAANE